MNEQLKNKIDGVCSSINFVFANNEPERENQLLKFAYLVSKSPNEDVLEQSVDMIISALENAFAEVKGMMN